MDPITVTEGPEARVTGPVAAPASDRHRRLSALAAFVTLDTRALATFRIGLGVLYVASLLRRFGDRRELYALLPANFPSLEWNRTVLPSPFWTLTPAQVDLGFALCALAFLLFTLGVCTRVMAIASWLALLALHNRMEFVETGGDIVLLLAALYATLFPLGDRASFDSLATRWWRRRSGLPELPVVASRLVPTFALLLGQWALIYGMNAVAKNGPTWRSGDALHVALQIDRLNTWLGYALSSFPGVTRVLAYGALLIEYSLPFLLLLPKRIERHRSLAAVLIVGLHSAIAATLNVGVFSFAMMSIVPLLLPPRFYEAAERTLTRRRERPATSPPPRHGVARPPAVVAIHSAVLSVLAAAIVYQACCERVRIDGLTIPRPEWFTRVSDAIRWRQGWTMFARNPPRETELIVVDAVTQGGEHVDPFQGFLTGRFEPLRRLPGTVGLNHFWQSYQDRIHEGDQPGRWEALARFVESHAERDGNPEDRIRSFAAWRLFTSTADALRRDPRPYGARLGRRFLGDDRPIAFHFTREDGVPDAARMLDGSLAPTRWAYTTPLAAVFASRCAEAEFETRRETTPTHAILEAFGAASYTLYGSIDGRRWSFLGMAMPAHERGADRFVVHAIRLRATAIRHLRVAASSSDGRASIAELRLYEGAPTIDVEALRAGLDLARVDSAPPYAPRREPLIHRPGPDSPCVARARRSLLLRPGTGGALRL